MVYTHKFMIEYFIKGLHPDEQGGIQGYLQHDVSTWMSRDLAMDKENGYRNVTGEHEIFKTAEEAEYYLNKFYVPKIVAVNERMIKNGRKPLFKDPADLKACYLWIDKLLEFQEVEKINEFLGCTSFKDFDPNSYEL